MAVAFMFEAAGVTQEQYDEAMKGIGHEALDAPIPEGVLAQISGPSADGWWVVDVWESEEAAGRLLWLGGVSGGGGEPPPLWRSHFTVWRVYEQIRHID